MKTFYFDCESYPIRPGLLTPKLVCAQFAYCETPPKIVLAGDLGDTFHCALADPGVLLEGHNSCFDQAVLSVAFPDLLPWWFRALGAGRGRDTLLREQLSELARGTFQGHKQKGHYSLAGVAKRRLNVEMDKGEETWRLRYALLDGVPVEEWPEPARRYALDDVTYLRAVSKAQNRDHVSPDEWFQVAAAFVLQLAATWGLRTDPVALEAVSTRLMTQRDECERLLEASGMWRDGSVDSKKVQAAVEEACLNAKRPVPKTEPSKMFPHGQTKKDAETIEDVAPNHAGLTALVKHGGYVKNLSTYLKPMELGTRHSMNSRPNVLVASGRTSWGGSKLTQTNPWWSTPPLGYEYEKVIELVGTNLQNQPQEVGIRDCFRARPGYVFSSTDYNSMELRCFGQAALWIVGYSTFAEGYQKDVDWDPHSYMAGKLPGVDLSYAEALALKSSKDIWRDGKTFNKGPRALGKALNFSMIGGVGKKRFKEMADAEGMPITLQAASDAIEAWLDAFRETRPYFEYVSWLDETRTAVKQFVSNRIRSGAFYSAIANTFFQGLAADIAKYALFLIAMGCYADPSSPLFDSRIVAFIHDEFLLESPEEKAHEAAMETMRLMNFAFSKFCPDVPSACEPTLMYAWSKAAYPKFVDGRLVPCDA